MKNRAILKIIGLPILTMVFSCAAFGAEVPQAGANPVVIDHLATTDNITYLMAAGAARPDTTSVLSFSAPKHAWLESVDDTEYLEWTVQTAVGENYHVTTLLDAGARESFNISVVGRSQNLSFSLPSSGWQRHDSGLIYLPAGTNTLRFTRTSNGGDIKIKSLELIANADRPAYLSRVSALKSDPSKLSDAKYGMMFQYGGWGYPQSGAAKSLEDQAADFDVNAFVATIKGLGAEYIIWSATWWTYEFNAPLSSVNSLLGHFDRTSSRDLIGDIASALDAEGIDFYLYYHTGQDSHLGYESTDWWRLQNWPSEFDSTGTGDRTTFFNNWKTVVSEIGNRYGSLLDGWFFDDGIVYYPAPFESLGAAAKAGNSDRLISYNAWRVAKYTEFQDIAFGEVCNSSGASIGSLGLYTSTPDAGLYGHCMHRTDGGWGIRSANQRIASPSFTVASAIATVQDASSRNVPTSFNLNMYEDGTMAQVSLDVLAGLKEEIRGSDTDTTDKPISEGKPAFQTSTAFGGLASRAVDGNTDGVFANNSVTHSARNERFPEWKVDLGSDIAIGQIDIFNRTDCCSGRLANFKVSIVDSNNNETWKSNHSTSPDPKLTVDAQGAVGRYVRVTILETAGTLALAEVQVYAE